MERRSRRYSLEAIKLELTHRCALCCIHCSSNSNPHTALEMSVDLANDILAQAVAMGVKEVSFSGGEPLLWRGLAQAVSFCKSASVKTEVYTSGNVDSSKHLLEDLRNAGVTKVIFSIYAPDAKSHDATTQVNGSFDKTMLAVDHAVDIGLPVDFHFVPLSTNYMHLTAILALARAKHVGQTSVLRFVPQGRGRDCSGLGLSLAQNLELKEAIERSQSELSIRTGSPYNFLLVNASPRCRAGEDRLTILPDSTIHPCDAFKQIRAESIVGTDAFSRLDRWRLRECWQKSPYLQAVRTYLAKPFRQPCAACQHLRRCLSGCVAQKYIAYGALVKTPDPMCLFQSGVKCRTLNLG